MGDKGERLLAVGDIHGCLDKLEQLMEQVSPKDADRVVFLGDYVDRGPDSRGVLNYLLDFRAQFPRSVFLKGNHEAMFLDYLEGRDPVSFLINGGMTTLQSYRAAGYDTPTTEHVWFLEGLPLYYTTDEFIFVHAGLKPGIPLDTQQERDLLWIRGEFLDSEYDWGKTIVFGHTPLMSPLIAPSRIGIDTGAVYNRKLTACEVKSRHFWSV